MAEQVQYRVKKRFKYGRRWYEAGELWQPDGGRNDTLIIRNGLVATERLSATERVVEKPAARAKTAAARPAVKE